MPLALKSDGNGFDTLVAIILATVLAVVFVALLQAKALILKAERNSYKETKLTVTRNEATKKAHFSLS